MKKRESSFFEFIFKTLILGICYNFLLLSKGFFFYICLPFSLFNKILNNKFIFKLESCLRKMQNDPISFLIVSLLFISFMLGYDYFNDSNNTVYVNDINNVTTLIDDKGELDNDKLNEKTEINLYKRYGSTKISDIDFEDLRKTNREVVAWLVVDGTSINYPIVQTNDNDYYLKHDFEGKSTANGWTFMDFRNSKDMNDKNTIFYGHNLLNKTGFGSLVNLFTDKWFNNSSHQIIVVTENKKYVYEVFSCYSIYPEVYYLQNEFKDEIDYQRFLNILVTRSDYDFGASLNTKDKIITLSTCTVDNNGRKVVHARLIG